MTTATAAKQAQRPDVYAVARTMMEGDPSLTVREAMERAYRDHSTAQAQIIDDLLAALKIITNVFTDLNASGNYPKIVQECRAAIARAEA